MGKGCGVMNWRMDGDFLLIVHELLREQSVLKLKDVVHHKVTNRLDHSLGVSYRSYRIAKRFGLDERAIARGALLHDLFLETREELRLRGLGSHNISHPKIACENAGQLTQLLDIEKDIILSHMFLCAWRSPRPRFTESWIVTMVDKWCAVGERTGLITY